MLITSLKPDPELYNPRVSPFIVRDPTFEHWKTLFGTTLFVNWAINTLWVAIASTAMSLFAACSPATRLPGSSSRARRSTGS